jgi:coenzyme F420 hydrogenase subunit beta
MAEGRPPRAVAKLARSAEEILHSQKSKYCPVPLLSILSDVEQLKQPIALVGLGCQIEGLQNLYRAFPYLGERIAFTIGLICDRTMTCAATDFLVGKAGLPPNDLKVLHFRDKTRGGYPGNVNVLCLGGASVSLPSSMRTSMKDFFTPARCRLCFDKMNVLADITVGDPWGIDGADTIGGESVAVVRTDVGARAFRSALNGGALQVREISYQEVLRGQRIERKRIGWRNYADAWQELGHPLPHFGQQIGTCSTLHRRGGTYRHHLQHAMELDQYSSREAVLSVAERLCSRQSLKRKFILPVRIGTRLLGKVTRRVTSGVSRC